MTRAFTLGGREYTVLLMTPLQQTDADLRQIAVVLLGVFPFALLLARRHRLSAGAAGAGADRPAAADRTTASRPIDLNERLGPPHPATKSAGWRRTINEMIARLERSFAEIRRFTADASHELRTPIAVIKGRRGSRTAAQSARRRAAFRERAGDILDEREHRTKLTDSVADAFPRGRRHPRFATEPVISWAAAVRGRAETMRPAGGGEGQSTVRVRRTRWPSCRSPRTTLRGCGRSPTTCWTTPSSTRRRGRRRWVHGRGRAGRGRRADGPRQRHRRSPRNICRTSSTASTASTKPAAAKPAARGWV